MRNIGAIAGFFLLLTGIWGILLFPSDELVRYAQCGLRQMAPEAGLIIDRLQLSLPPGLAVENLAVLLRDKSAVQVDQLRVVPGMISLLQDRARHPLSLRLAFSEIRLNLPLPIISSFHFKKIQTDLEWQPEKLKITSLAAEGAEMNGNLSGEILLDMPLAKSRLQLTGMAYLKPETLNRLKNSFLGAGVPARTPDGGGIPFQITGTFETPLFSLK